MSFQIISFVLMIKLYLKDTKSEIINMKPTEEGKKERRKRLKKKVYNGNKRNAYVWINK